VDATFLDGSNTPQLHFDNSDNSGFQMVYSGGTSGSQQIGSGAAGAGRERYVMRLMCHRAAGCSTTGYAGVTNVRFEVTDYSAPIVGSVGGSLFNGAWLRGTGHTASGSPYDYGSGVRRSYVTIDGNLVGDQMLACDSLSGTSYHRTLSPCQAASSSEGLNGVPRPVSFSGVNLAQGQFSEGTHTVALCAEDLAHVGTPNASCSSAALRIDNIAPATPSGLTVAGGEDWRATNDFDVSWTNPAQPGDVAPLASTHYRLTSSAGYNSGDNEVGLTNALNNLTVPTDGEYTLEVWAEDAAGNASAANSRTVQLRFDDTVPPESEAEYNGWVRRADFPYTVRWDRVEVGALGPSGLEGYAVTVTDVANSDPCVTAGHPAPTCADSEVTNPGGIDDLTEVIENAPEGGAYIHVAPVTGAGVKAAAVKHTPMPVDQTDPVSAISGVPSAEWVNTDVTLTVNATDSLSGMVPEVRTGDPQPQTTIAVDGQPFSDPDAAVTRTISTEGVHRVSYWASDLAGNENDGAGANNAPGTATVRIDKTAPLVAFQNAESVNDPSLIKAPTQDALSGVESGRIELRRLGTAGDVGASAAGEWEALPTELAGDHLEARVPDDVEPGRYEMRVISTDHAGNSRSSGLRENGEPMVVNLPLKTGTHLAAGIGKQQKPKRKLAYGRPSVLRGHLQSTAGNALAGRDIVITELRGPGSRVRTATRIVQTDAQGDFRVPLSGGPSRVVNVRYEGDNRYAGSKVENVRMLVRARVLRFLAPNSVGEDERIVFTGRIGVLGVKLGKLGKLVELQYRKGRVWKTIQTGRTGKRGRFALRYALRSDYTQPVTVTFRLRIPKERKWPYIGGAVSRQQSVIIRPE
jgi:hypothetical protein